LGTNGTENALKDSANVFKLGFGFWEKPRGTRWQQYDCRRQRCHHLSESALKRSAYSLKRFRSTAPKTPA
jgi:hypothetical protein